MARLVGIDYGSKRVGIAVTDVDQRIATALTTVRNMDVITFLTDYLKRENVEAFVVGAPKHLNGEANDSTHNANRFVEKLKTLFPNIPIHRVDERFTSKMATQAILMSGVKKKDRQNKELVDTVSAAIILQSFLEQKFYL